MVSRSLVVRTGVCWSWMLSLRVSCLERAASARFWTMASHVRPCTSPFAGKLWRNKPVNMISQPCLKTKFAEIFNIWQPEAYPLRRCLMKSKQCSTILTAKQVLFCFGLKRAACSCSATCSACIVHLIKAANRLFPSHCSKMTVSSIFS